MHVSELLIITIIASTKEDNMFNDDITAHMIVTTRTLRINIRFNSLQLKEEPIERNKPRDSEKRHAGQGSV
jgi:hypothetical protein